MSPNKHHIIPDRQRPQLILEQGMLRYREYIAPTIETQMARLKEVCRKGIKKRIDVVLEGATPSELAALALRKDADIRRMMSSPAYKEVDKWWEDLRKLSYEYYSDASIQVMLERYEMSDTMFGFDYVSGLELQLMERFFEKLCEKNPAIQKRYDGLRLVADMPADEMGVFRNVDEAPVRTDRRKGIRLMKLWESEDFSLDVYTLDINEDWIMDRYILDSYGNAMYQESMMERDKGIPLAPRPEIRHLPELFDPLHPEWTYQWHVKMRVQHLLSRFRKGSMH